MRRLVQDVDVHLIALLLCCAAAGGQTGQERTGGSGPEVKPLAAKQEMLRDRLRRLEDRMFRLREKLAEGEPDSAAKLAKALERLGEAEVDAKVERLMELLADDTRLFRAGTLQQELLDDLESVLSVLLLRSDPDARRQRMELLEQYRQEVGDVLEAERALRSEAAHAAATARRAQQIADALRRIDRLIGEEAAVAEASQA
ncbi:MAG: hypothetical protein ACYSUI_24650, partial [Planctomycetota bacterium]